MSTATEYQRITGKPGKWFPAVVTSHSVETHFAFLTVGYTENLQLLLGRSQVELGLTSIDRPNLSRDGRKFLTLKVAHVPDNKHVENFPVFHYKYGAPFMDVILDFPNGDKLSEFFKL